MKSLLTLIAFVIIGFQCMACDGGGCTSTITSNFNSTGISARNKIWFSAVLHVTGHVTYPVTIYFKDQTITSSAFSLSVPDGQLILDASATTATTVYNGTEWITVAPPSASGNYFISGSVDSLHTSIRGGLNPVRWSGTFLASRSGVDISWQWGAAVYTSLNPNMNNLAIKPSDCSSCSAYRNTDHAGSPESYRSYLISGAGGTGRSNYTGSYSVPDGVNTCTAVTPSVNITSSTSSICEGSAVTFRATSVNGGSRPSYQWKKNGMNVGSGSTSYSCSGLTGSDSIWCVLTSNDASAAPITATSNVRHITISSPSVSAGSDVVICPGGSATLTASGAATYRWQSSLGLSAITGAVVTATPLVTTTYTVTGTSSSGCTGTSTVTVSVNATPLSVTLSGADSVCAAAVDTLSSSVAGGLWTSSNTAVASIAGGIVAGIAAGTTTISYVVAGGCGISAGTKTITVKALPIAGIVTGTSVVCSGQPAAFSDVTPGGKWRSGNSALAFIDTTGAVTTGSWGVVNISYTVRNSCGIVWATKTLTVNALPVVMPVTGGGGYCPGSAGADVSLPGGPMGINYQLYRDTTAIGSPVSGPGMGFSFGLQTVPGSYSVVATNTVTGCTSTMGGSVTVSINPTPAVYSVTGGGDYCSGSGGVHVSICGSDTGINYTLLIGSMAIGSPLAGTGSALDFGLQTIAGTYTVIARGAHTGCTSAMSGSASVLVDPLPYAGIITGTSLVALGDTIYLSDTVAGGFWHSSDTSIATVDSISGIVTGISDGFANISYTVVNPCGSAITVFTVHAHGKSKKDKGGDGGPGPGDGGPGAHKGATPGEEGQDLAPSLVIYPNPGSGNFTITGTIGTQSDEQVTIRITDVIGRVVYSSSVFTDKGKLNKTVDLNTLSQGTYLLNAHTDTADKIFHIIIER